MLIVLAILVVLAIGIGLYIWVGADERKNLSTQWTSALALTEPKRLQSAVNREWLRERETPVFVSTSYLCEPMITGQTVSLTTSGRTGQSLVGTALGGVPGAVIGASGSRATSGLIREKTSIMCIAKGALIVTNQRIRFEGRRLVEPTLDGELLPKPTTGVSAIVEIPIDEVLDIRIFVDWRPGMGLLYPMNRQHHVTIVSEELDNIVFSVQWLPFCLSLYRNGAAMPRRLRGLRVFNAPPLPDKIHVDLPPQLDE